MGSNFAHVSSICRAAIGRPAYEAPGVLLYHGDAIDMMAALPDSLVELTVTSPPYNIGKTYERQLPLDDYIDWTGRWIQEVYRLTNVQGAFWLNLGYLSIPGRARAIPIPYLIWDRVPFFLVQEVVWNYAAGVAAKRAFSPRNEKFLWYTKSAEHFYFDLDSVRDPNVKYPNQRKNGRLRVNSLGKNPTDVWAIPKVTTGEGRDGQRASRERTKHPAQFPIALINRIIKACSRIDDLVMDPFMGSGTTAEAAMANGRIVIGFEVQSEYIEISSQRLDRFQNLKGEEYSQQRLFGDIQSA